MQTDHAPLRHLPNQASVNSRVWKWINILQGYDLKLRHIPSKKNPAESLSQQHFADACKQRIEVKEEEKDLVSVLRIKPHATNEDIQNALSKIFVGKDSEIDAVSIVNADQAQDQNQRSDTVEQPDGPEPTAHLLVLSSTVRLDADLKERMKAALSTEYPYSEILQELESEREVTRGREKFNFHNGLLFQHLSRSVNDNEEFWRVVVPNDQNIKTTILTELHSVPYAGHPGF